MKKFANPVDDNVTAPSANKRRLEKTLRKMLGSDFILSIPTPLRERAKPLPQLRAMAK